MYKAREQHNVLMDKGREQLTAFGVSCYTNIIPVDAHFTYKRSHRNDSRELQALD
jgi:hypothetical protein